MVKKLLLLLLAVLTSATGVWAQAYTNPTDKSWDFSQGETQSGENGIAFEGLTYRGLGDGQNGYQLINGWIAIPVEAGQIVTFNLISIDTHQAYYQVTKETEGHSVLETIKFSGVKDTSTPRYVKADQKGWIKIVRDPDNNQGLYGGVRSIVLENAPTVAFSSDQCVAELIDLNVAEPTLSYPTPSTVTYSVSNEKIAKLRGENAPGDIMCVNTGITGVTATVNYKGNTYTASYTLTVKADDATYKVEGNTYTLTGSGKLQERVVNLVPKITMEFGSTEVVNTTIVRNEANAPIVGTTLDANGWRHLCFNSTDGLVHPYQGTFYTFKPKTAGKLTVTGYLNNTAQTAYIVNANNLAPVPERETGTSGYSFTPVSTITTSSESQLLTTTVDLEGGETYYLYGNIPSSNGMVDQWSTYQLKSFSFESTFRYEKPSVVLAAGATAGGQQVTGVNATAPTFSMELKGGLKNATLNNDGTVSNIEGDGGAIIVTATYEGDQISYVITVPYSSHEWWFWNTDNFPKDLNTDLDWATTYEVRSYDQTTRALYYLNEPILTAAEGLQGNNAMYIGETAGLVVNAEAKTFGLRSSSDNLGDYATFRAFFLENSENSTKYASYISDYDLDNLTEDRFSELKGDGAFVDVYLKAMLNYTKEDSRGTNIPAMNPGATITIPNVKAGSHIAIKWYRHAPEDGDHILLTNAVDLDGKDISNGIYVVNQGRGSNIFGNPYGWLEFKAKDDGNVTLRSEKGWTHLKAIVLKEDGFYDTNLAIVNENSNSACKTLYTYTEGGSQSNTYSTKAYYTRSENGVEYVYTVKYDNDTKGTANATISGGTLTATGQGQATLVLTCYSNGYAIDRETKLLTFREITQTHQDYPYTWDFTNISAGTKTKLENDGNWTGNTSDGFKPSTTAQGTFTQGGDLHFNDSDVPELDELGFITSVEGTTSTGLSNVTLKTDGTGVVIGGQETTNIIVPDVPEGATVYVRVVTNENSEINGDEILTDGDDKVYTFEGSGTYSTDESQNTAADITVSLKDITVEGIAVTNIYKEMRMASATNAGYYYNTDCQSKDIDYSLTKYYTGIEIKADYISSEDLSKATVNPDDESGTLIAKTVEKAVPANTGLVVYTTNGKNNTLYPLFVPGINAEKESISDNLLTGVVFTSGASSTDHLYKYAPNAEAAGSTWYDFRDWESKQDIAEPITKDGLTVSGKEAEKNLPDLSDTDQTYDAEGLRFTRCWKSQSSGSSTSNYVSFTIEKAGDYIISVYGMSNGKNTERTLKIKVGTGAEADILKNDGNAVTKGQYSATVADNTTVYLYSAGSGFNIYGIKVESAHEADQEPVDVVFYTNTIENTVSSENYRYFFTNAYYSNSEPGVVKHSDDPMFFRTTSPALKSNRAYLDIPKTTFGSSTNSVKSIRIIGLFNKADDDATAIELISAPADATAIDLNGEFYTISGVKLKGVPTQPGIYIQNGKKVMMK